MKDWQIQHKQVIQEFVLYLNRKTTGFVLKGGTSLMLCYGLTRFSEDIDLDSTDKNFFKYVEGFAKETGYSYCKAKDTDTVKRAFIHYSDNSKPLKIEVSYRNTHIDTKIVTRISDITVYNIQSIMMQKINAFNHRDKIRDLYDVSFIYIRYKGYLDSCILFMLRDTIGHKGIEQFDYLVRNQSDELIDNNTLLKMFMTMYYDLGLV